MDRESEVSGAVCTCLTMMGKPGVWLGGIPRKESSFMVFVFVVFFLSCEIVRFQMLHVKQCPTGESQGREALGPARGHPKKGYKQQLLLLCVPSAAC